MFIDKQLLLSEDQAITTTARSTNVINLGAAGVGRGEPIEVLCQVTTTFAGGTSIIAALMTDSDATIATGGVVLVQTAAIAAASLVAGYQFRLSTLGVGALQYIDINYTVSGTFTSGKLTAGLIIDRQASF